MSSVRYEIGTKKKTILPNWPHIKIDQIEWRLSTDSLKLKISIRSWSISFLKMIETHLFHNPERSFYLKSFLNSKYDSSELQDRDTDRQTLMEKIIRDLKVTMIVTVFETLHMTVHECLIHGQKCLKFHERLSRTPLHYNTYWRIVCPEHWISRNTEIFFSNTHVDCSRNDRTERHKDL